MGKLFLSLATKPKALLVLLVIAVVTAGASFVLYNKSQEELSAIKKNPQAAAQQETKELVTKVGLLVALPEGEQPTVATVTDVSKIKDQPFFKKAQNGDKVLIFTKAKKAYLYSVSLNKILEIAPVNIGASQPGQVAGASESPTPAPKE